MKMEYVAVFLCIVLLISSLVGCQKTRVVGDGTDNSEEIPVSTEIVSLDGNDYKPKSEDVTVERSQLRDRVLGAWIGHVIGMGSGYEYVWGDDGQPWIAMEDKYWEPNGEIVSGTLGVNALRVGPYDVSYQRVFKGMVKSDDDILIDVFNQWVLKNYDGKVGHYELTKAWKEHKIGDAAGGEEAMRIISNNDYIAPYVGQYAYGNSLYTATEPWIENETLGLLFPYMPVRAESMADVFTTVSGDAYGIYLGKLCAIAYSYALTTDSAPVALEKAFEHMEKSNMIYDAYQYVLECYANDPKDWRACIRGLVKRSTGQNMMGLNTLIDLYVNAGFIFTGVVFGENDFEQSIKIAGLAGYDGDCTCATVGGLLGAVKGYESLPKKYKEYLDGNSVFVNDKSWFSNIGADFPDQQTFDEITDLTMKNMEVQIAAAGGSIEADTYQIKKQLYTGKVQSIVENYGFDKDTTEPWQVSGPGKLSLTETLHTGPHAGGIRIENTKEDVKAYQKLKLVKGDIYQVVMYVSVDIGKEFRIYAEDKENYFYRSYSTPVMSLDRFIRAELYFCASSEDMEIGIHIPAQTNTGVFLAFDDVQVLNVSHKVARTGERLEAEYAEGTEKVQVVEAEDASGKAAVQLSQEGALRFHVTGRDDCFQNIRVYYSNKEFMATLKVTVDGTESFRLPLVAQGETSGFSEGNFADFNMFLGEGQHELVLRLVTDNELLIDKIEVRAGDINLEVE